LPPVPLFQHLTSREFLGREALVSGPDGRAFSYAQLLTAARAVQAQLQQQLGKVDLREERIAMLYPSGFSYVAALLGAWLSGAIAVPLHPAHPPPELEYLLADAGASVLLVDPSMAPMAHALAKPPQPLDEREMRVIEWNPDESQAAEAAQAAKPIDYGSAEQFMQRRAMFIYTSGTTGKVSFLASAHTMAANGSLTGPGRIAETVASSGRVPRNAL
jgi:malonyl-CoA/methylmalonyl-CoA synthetase